MQQLVMHVVPHLDFGGVESHMAILGSQLPHARYRHVFVAIGNGGRVESVLRQEGIDVICLQQDVGIPSIPALRQLRELFLDRRPMVVHCHGAEANFHGLIGAAAARVPVRIGEEIGLPSHGLLARFVFSIVYRLAHRVIGVSQGVVDWLVRSGEVADSRAIAMELPVCLPSTRIMPPTDDGVFRVGFVGRLEYVKNLQCLLDAFQRLIALGADGHLWLVGDGQLRTVLENHAAALGIHDRVHIPGFQPNPAQWVERWDVCIQPSHSEGFGLAMIEAMGCGVPVISTPVGVACDVIVDGKNGWITDGFDIDSITTALMMAWRTSSSRRQEMGLAAREAVHQRYSPQRYLETLEQFYDVLGEEVEA